MKKLHRQDVSMRAPSRRMWRRSLLILVIIAICLSAVGIKLATIQIGEHELWQTRASEQQMADSIISDKRGAITDRNGVVLAESVEVTTIIMRPSEIPDEAARVTISDDLSAMLDIDRAKLYKKTGKKTSQYEVVKSKIGDELCAQFVEWVESHRYTGIFRIIEDYKRVYPLGNTLSCVLGFTGTDNTGLEGLEAKYNDVLAGKAGRLITAKNGWGDALPNDIQYETTVEAGEGNTLVLTVDATIQQIAEKYLEVAVAETGAANRACAIVMDVKTSQILAMVTKGDYDLNAPRTLVDPDVVARIAQLSGSEKSDAYIEALQKQWKNKAISEFYEPGSVFKIFTASMALQEGLISEKSHFFCNGTFTMPGVRMMKCHIYPRSHGDQTLAEAISHSCNPAFMKIGSLVGPARFARYHELFGFTSLTGIDMLGEARVTDILYHTPSAITAVDVATSSIGQTFKVTPIQMITGVCAAAGGGNLRQPYIVGKILAPDGHVMQTNDPVVKRRVISGDTSARMCALLEGVVDGGGAKNAYVAGYRVAGKTGTSEKTDQATDGGRKNVVASFCGFAPANDPAVAVLVMIDEPQTYIRYGGVLAAPVAQKILADVLPYLGIAPQYKEKELTDHNRQVPDLSGKTVSAAQSLLETDGLNIRIVGDGTGVTGQMPAAGATIGLGGTVVVYTDGQIPAQISVPAVEGQTLTDANRLLTDAGLNLLLKGWTDASSTAEKQAIIRHQSLPAGTTVLPGTVITLELNYQDAIA